MREHLEAVIAHDERAIELRLQWLAESKTEEGKQFLAKSLENVQRLKAEEEAKLAKLKS